ncbi:unnamed protein product [Larinioides sclopetarius]|uniref:Uncharacterized protein n=1 Tax=Larinioides sclopetarius TaxID=280406 RepID=A0AAV1ZAF4_9ARAC
MPVAKWTPISAFGTIEEQTEREDSEFSRCGGTAEDAQRMRRHHSGFLESTCNKDSFQFMSSKKSSFISPIHGFEKYPFA